jgi:TRAP-type C4-dicarboxylate transport system substrate-binding protein
MKGKAAKKGLFVGAGIVLVFLLAFPSMSTAQVKKYKWRLSQVMPADSDHDIRAKAFAKEVKERTKGRIDITVYSGGVLGDWVETTEMVMRGAVDMALDPIAPTYDPRLNITYYMPYVAETMEKAKKIYSRDSFMHTLVNEIIEPLNMKGLAIYPVGSSGCTLDKVPPSPGDPDVPKNLKMRVMPIRLCELTWKRLGYLPTAIPWAEVYPALQTGVADGQMGGPPYQGYTVRDVQKCWIQYNDFFEIYWFYMNKKLWDGLSAGDKKIFLEAAERQCQGRWKTIAEEDEKYRNEMKKSGLEIIMLSEPELERCAAAIRKDVWPEMEKIVGKALMDRIYTALKIKR